MITGGKVFFTTPFLLGYHGKTKKQNSIKHDHDEYPDYFKILPSINNWSKDPERIGDGKKVDSAFIYSSDNNKEWMEVSELQEWIEKNYNKIGAI